MKIYTKTGDDGKTSLFDNSRVWKSHERIVAYGAVDELNSAVGIAISMDLDHQLKEILIRIQNELFIVGSDLANPDMSDTKIRTTENMISSLENDIDTFESELSELTNFILPGGTLMSSILHLSRTIARRAETDIITLSQKEETNKRAAMYLNRLSDLLFVLARVLNIRKNVADVVWKH